MIEILGMNYCCAVDVKDLVKVFLHLLDLIFDLSHLSCIVDVILEEFESRIVDTIFNSIDRRAEEVVKAYYTALVAA